MQECKLTLVTNLNIKRTTEKVTCRSSYPHLCRQGRWTLSLRN